MYIVTNNIFFIEQNQTIIIYTTKYIYGLQSLYNLTYTNRPNIFYIQQN